VIRVFNHFLCLRLCLCLHVVAAVVTLSTAAFSFANEDDEKPIVMPQDLSLVTLYLHTVDAGDAIYSKFGHTAVRVRDDLAKTDMVYNLGTFDASDPLFALNFYRGDMKYRMSDYPNRIASRVYAIDQRPMWEDELRLTAAEKRVFLQRLITQSLPENRSYSYQYFFDNCSTRFRDFFDDALDGSFKRDTFDVLSKFSFRDMVRSHLSSISFIAMSLDIIMNSNLDRKMTLWEEMFLPLKLREHLLKMKNSEGLPVLVESTVLVEANGQVADKVHAYFWILGATFILIGAFIVTKRIGFEKALVRLWVIISTFVGTVLIMNWVFSGHSDLHHNANVLVFFPLDIYFWWYRYPKKWLRSYAYLRFAMIGMCLALSWSGTIDQDTLRVTAVFGFLAVAAMAVGINPYNSEERT
jgi:hypothetical protein